MTKAQRRAALQRAWRDYMQTPFLETPHHARTLQVTLYGVAVATGVGGRRGRRQKRSQEREVSRSWERARAADRAWRRAWQLAHPEDIPF